VTVILPAYSRIKRRILRQPREYFRCERAISRSDDYMSMIRPECADHDPVDDRDALSIRRRNRRSTHSCTTYKSQIEPQSYSADADEENACGS